MALMTTTTMVAQGRRTHVGLGALLTLSGIIGLISSFVLTHDELELAKNPDFVPSCNLSAILNCTDVMKSDQAVVFGFPNPWIGLIAFPVVVTLGLLLLAKVDFPEWIWAGFQVGATLGIASVLWLQYQTIYEITALCPWCMATWAVVIPTFIYVTIRNVRAWFPGNPIAEFLGDWHALILILWYIAVGAAIFFRFYA